MLKSKYCRYLVILLLIIANSKVSLAQYNIELSNLEISKCITEIESKTNFKFVFNPKLKELNKKVSLSINNGSIENILTSLLNNSNLNYKIFDGSIIAIQLKNETKNTILFKGQILSELGQPLPKASVSEIGNINNVVLSDEEGYFYIFVPETKKILIKYTGYAFKELSSRDDLSKIMLTPTLQNLDEVVVVGYGTQKITKVSGAISTIKSSDIEKINAVRTEEALQGRATGVNVIQSGVPGQKPTVLIRGIPSFSGVDPLIIVDGIQQSLDDLNSISAADIESISVLKDAAASAIYGVRGGNGVIVVTTKIGRKQTQTVFKISLNNGWQDLLNKVQVLNGKEYAAIINEGSATAGRPIIFSDFSKINSTNWQDEIFTTAPFLNYNISAQGGSEKVVYFLAGSYVNQSGIVGGADKSNFTRTNFTSNVQFDLSKKLKFIFNTTGVFFNSKGGYYEQGFNSVIGAALNYDPTVTVYNNNPNVLSTYGYSNLLLSEIHNPVTMLANTYNAYNGFKLYGKTELQYQVIKNLKLTTRFGYTKYEDNSKSFAPLIFWGVNNVDNSLNPDGSTVAGKHNSVTNEKFSNFNYIFENFGEYNLNIKDAHHINIIAGMAASRIYGNKAGASRQDVPFNSWEFADFTGATAENSDIELNAKTGYYYQYEKRNLSFFGRVNYDYEDRYLFSFSLRRDGSTAFGSNNKFGTFPAASVGWVISKEKFFDNVENIQLLKLRGSYGITGNDNVTNPTNVIIVTGGPSYAQFPPNSNGYTYGGSFLPGSTVGTIANNDLRWEQQEQTNIGLDFSFAKYFNLQIDWFKKGVNGLLFTPSASLYLGTVPKPSQNIGNTESKGWEITFEFTKNLTKKVYLQTSLIFTTVKNLVLSTNQDGTARIVGGGYFNGQSQYVTVFEKGFTPGYFYGFKTDGLFQNQEDLDSWATQNGAVPGDIKFVDVNQDGVIDDKDRTKIGDPFPTFTLGWNFNLKFYNFDFVCFVYASYGNDVYRAYERNAQYSNKYAAVLERWTGPNTTNDSRFPRYSFQDANSNIRVSDRYVEDGSFIKIKNIQLGYNWNFKNNKNALRVYLQVKNAFTFTKYSGFDPEISGGILESGVDRGSYPQARNFAIGVDIKL
ncbi:MAG: SusC/RagA family TonB-linked outer membrane protein [Alphaproteobacteria bacterium]|nr:SusC/RagA family TonB-linked outer membrane protein [Alphaproteobacteria bacterium]